MIPLPAVILAVEKNNVHADGRRGVFQQSCNLQEDCNPASPVVGPEYGIVPLPPGFILFGTRAGVPVCAQQDSCGVIRPVSRDNVRKVRALILATLLLSTCLGQELPDAPLPQPPPPALHVFNQHTDYTLFKDVPSSHFMVFVRLEFKDHVQESPFRFSLHFNSFSLGYEIHHTCGFLPPGPPCHN